MGLIVVHINSTYFFFSYMKLWFSLILIPPVIEYITFWDTIFYVIVNDIIVRLGTIFIKALVVLLFGGILVNKKRKAQLFALIESISQLYRTIIPLPVWFTYFTQDDFGQFMSSAIAGLYLISKSTTLLNKSRQCSAIFSTLWCQEVQYGTYATTEQLTLAGDMCSICQEKMKNPIILQCKHIFCEECVSEWFEREKTCPLCRAVIKTAGNKTHSDGSTSQIAYFFLKRCI